MKFLSIRGLNGAGLSMKSRVEFDRVEEFEGEPVFLEDIGGMAEEGGYEGEAGEEVGETD